MPSLKQLAEKLLEAHSKGDLSPEARMKDFNWDSLTWASFLSELFMDVEPQKRDILLVKVLIENNLDDLTVKEFSELFDE